MDAALRGGVALAHLVIDGAADDVAGCPFATLVIAKHGSLAIAVQQDAAGAKPFSSTVPVIRVLSPASDRSDGTAPFPCRGAQPGTKRHGNTSIVLSPDGVW